MSQTSELRALSANELYRRCDLSKFKFANTAELADLTDFVGQERAVKAVEFGSSIQRQGFNLYLLGPSGTGKFSGVRAYLQTKAATEPTPEEWCYVNNFENPETPHALRLPPGRGALLREDMRRLLDNLRSAIPSAFESESYTARKHAIEQEVKEQQEKAFEDIQNQANEQGIAVLRTPTGIALAPMRGEEVVSPKEFQELPEAEHRKIQAAISELQEKLQTVLRQVPRLEQEGREKIRKLNQEVAIFAVGHLIDELRNKYADLREIVTFLDAVQKDIIENVDAFLASEEHPLAALMGISLPYGAKGSTFFRRYNVNVLVDHSGTHGAPVVYEDHPTYQNIVGQVEYMAHLGAVSTDFNLISCGCFASGKWRIPDPRRT